MTIYWAPLLHIYQPPTQEIGVLRKINTECYEPLFTMINEFNLAKFSLNINAVLIEMLIECELGHTLDLIKSLVSKTSLELVGTAKFHPILPLIPKKEVYRQIHLNEAVIKKEFGNMWEPKGFFPPEMAISPTITQYIRDLGYKWVIQSGIAFPMNENKLNWPTNTIYSTTDNLQLYFRDDLLSNKISFKETNAKQFISQIKNLSIQNHSKNEDMYIITAMDGETFGHHIKNYEKTFLKKVLNLVSDDEEIEIMLISDLEHIFPRNKEKIIPNASSWSTTASDLQNKVFYPLWKNKKNSIHKYYWKILASLNQLMNIIEKLDLAENWTAQEYYTTARWFYDRGICSDTTWWANPPNMWSPNMIYKGVILLMKAALNAQLALITSNKIEGEGYFDSISYYHSLLMMEISSLTQEHYKNHRD